MKRKKTVAIAALACSFALLAGCIFDKSGMPLLELCGNGTLDGTEDCDDGNVINGDGCQSDCTCPVGMNPNGSGGCLDPALCGNGTLDASEECDDGNVIDDDGCQSDCTCPVGMDPNGVGGCLDPALCGDGTVDPGEECDDVGQTGNCDEDCTFPSCGDGHHNALAGEICDDGGETASCDSDCTLPACGDAHLNTTAGEVCDTGGESASCNDDCTPSTCGDGNVNQVAGEQCDTSGESASCNNDCTLATCGDGLLNETAGEVCDDGNTVSADGCSANCHSDETCGNGILDAAVGEVCDDSNTDSGDGCSADCLSDETCGNGILDVNEACDGGTDCLSCLCPEGKGSDGVGGCQVDASTCGDGIDNDGDGDTDCDDTDCGVITIYMNSGGNIYVETATDSQSQGSPLPWTATIIIDSVDAWARIYVTSRASDASNAHGFLYWEDPNSFPHPAFFGTPGTPAPFDGTSYVQSVGYGEALWTNYHIACQ